MKKTLPLIVLISMTTLAINGYTGDENAKGHDKGKARPDKPYQTDKSYQADKDLPGPGHEAHDISLVLAGISIAQARDLATVHHVTGYKPLPPGIRRNLARGKPLPPGIAKQSLPPGMLRSLPRHEGYEWQRCGSDLILVSLASAVIADVLVDVFL